MVNLKTLILSSILFILLSISIFSPIGSIFSSYEYLPDNDFRSHSALVIQAKMALDEHQFPIRVAPLEYEGLHYPEYQFYGQLPFMLAGLIYKLFSYTHSAMLSNPFNTLKLIMLLSLMFGGLFAYRLARLFSQSDVASVLAATAYIYSPYILFNLTLNGDFTEVVAQGILPVALFYSFKMLIGNKLNILDSVFSALAWFVVLTSHLITFAYGSWFFVMAAFLFLIFRLCTPKAFIISMLSILFSWTLAASYILPIVLLAPHLAASGGATGANVGAGLSPTSIYNLFALNADTSGRSVSLPRFYASVGWIYLLSFITCLYYVFKPASLNSNRQFKLILVMCVLFALALFFSWSWMNNWRYLPYYFSIGQFGHRFLAQMMWLGIILFVLAADILFDKSLDARHLVIGIFLITFASSSWLIKPSDGIKVAELLAKPKIYAGEHDYFIRPDTLPSFPGLKQFGFIQLPLVTVDKKLLLDKDVKINHDDITPDAAIILQGKLDSHAQNGRLLVKLNNQIIANKIIKSAANLDWRIPVSNYLAGKKYSVLRIEFIPVNKKQINSFNIKRLNISINRFELLNHEKTRLNIMPVAAVKTACSQYNTIIECKVTSAEKSIAVQLPILFYPHLAHITVDGEKVDYAASYYHSPNRMTKFDNFDPDTDWIPYTVATIITTAGTHQVVINDDGMNLANKVSIFAWILFMLFALAGVVKYFKRA